MSLSRYEMETYISFNEEEEQAVVHTYNGKILRVLQKMEKERPDECKKVRAFHEGKGAEYTVPKSWAGIRPSRILNDEQLKAARENARRLNERRKNPI